MTVDDNEMQKLWKLTNELTAQLVFNRSATLELKQQLADLQTKTSGKAPIITSFGCQENERLREENTQLQDQLREYERWMEYIMGKFRLQNFAMAQTRKESMREAYKMAEQGGEAASKLREENVALQSRLSDLGEVARKAIHEEYYTTESLIESLEAENRGLREMLGVAEGGNGAVTGRLSFYVSSEGHYDDEDGVNRGSNRISFPSTGTGSYPASNGSDNEQPMTEHRDRQHDGLQQSQTSHTRSISEGRFALKSPLPIPAQTGVRLPASPLSSPRSLASMSSATSPTSSSWQSYSSSNNSTISSPVIETSPEQFKSISPPLEGTGMHSDRSQRSLRGIAAAFSFLLRPFPNKMSPKSFLAIHHATSLSVGGIVRYRIKVIPSQASKIESLQFRVRNCAPVLRNLTPASGPWKISLALIRNPDILPVVPDLVPAIGCSHTCHLNAQVRNPDSSDENDGNEWELEVISEMVMQSNWINIKVEVYANLRQDTPTDQFDRHTEGTDKDEKPRVYLPELLTCDYKDTEDICGPVFPQQAHGQGQQGVDGEKEDELHLVLLTHGIHGSWLDLLYLKEQIDAQNAQGGKTVTFLTDTNHSGTEEGIQMAGRRVASDILEFTGYYNTEEGKNLKESTMTRKKSVSALSGHGSPKVNNRSQVDSIFPRGFSKVSIIGHSLGGLINIYALGYIDEVTKGAFFKTIQPVHFIAMATPLLGVGFEHPWVLGTALSLGCIGQTGKDLAIVNRSHNQANSTSQSPSTTGQCPEGCSLDHSEEPLLVAMANPSSSSHKVLKQFQDRTLYANIDNDMAVRFNTSTMMGIPKFDIDHYFSPEGSAPTSRKNLYHAAAVSVMALLFPKVPSKAKFRNIANAPSPISIISHTKADPLTNEEEDEEIDDTNTVSNGDKKNDKSRPHSPISSKSSKTTSFRSTSSTQGPSNTKKINSMSRAALANVISEDYHTDMDWTKIGVFIEHEAHVQIIVRRKWYNLDGWKSVQDLVERFNFQ
ncbi:hypothetical protein BGZ76_001652 [Entomortierella beljakovae]|nr:hypothetical protein BGZ76_001652 [Entomortierella beljakovae]